jgi:O-acetyl-ADP-ribose deacetylase (regulator of RNase III)
MNQSQDIVIKLANFTLRNLKQNIVHMKTDAIVNAANQYLGRGGGVCGAIFKACG